MLSTRPKILALDFDGVICDGMDEYFQTTQLTYQKIWSDQSETGSLEESFKQLRPVIETGWEMPILLRAIALGIPAVEINADWPTLAANLVEQEGLETKALSFTLDQIRDEWIATDLDSWLGLHRFYEGVIPRLQSLLNSDTTVYIVTTKEGRFVQQLLKQAGLELSSEAIFGKEIQQPKYQTLRDLLAKTGYDSEAIWFVEDRAKALELVKDQTDLEGVGLFLATWGYNTPATREAIAQDSRLKLLNLEQFQQDFSDWCA